MRPSLKGSAAAKYKQLLLSAEKGKARREAVERQQAFAAGLDEQALRVQAVLQVRAVQRLHPVSACAEAASESASHTPRTSHALQAGRLCRPHTEGFPPTSTCFSPTVSLHRAAKAAREALVLRPWLPE